MADEQQSKPSFKHAVVKKALAPLVATAVTAATTYLMRKAAELWQETIQPKLEEKGGAEAVAREAAEKVAPVADAVTSMADAVTSKAGQEPEVPAKAKPKADSDGDRNEERRKREQRRKQRRKSLEQAGSS